MIFKWVEAVIPGGRQFRMHQMANGGLWMVATAIAYLSGWMPGLIIHGLYILDGLWRDRRLSHLSCAVLLTQAAESQGAPNHRSSQYLKSLKALSAGRFLSASAGSLAGASRCSGQPQSHRRQAKKRAWLDLWQETLAMTKRLFIQLQRRPSSLMLGIIQPLVWLLLFGALFQNSPGPTVTTYLTPNMAEPVSHAQFLAAGLIVFTAFNGALSSGLSVMFDREFGFLNRLLMAPLVSRFSIVFSAAAYIVVLSLIQAGVIMVAALLMGAGMPGLGGLMAITLVISLLVCGVTALSLALAFALPGHVEMLGVIFLLNLPALFTSTALAPLDYMAKWLSYLALLNPLSYAVEPIRYLYLHHHLDLSSVVLATPWLPVSFAGSLGILLLFDGLILLLVRPLLKRCLG